VRVIDILYRTSDTRINDPLNLPDNRVDEMIKGEVMVQRVVIAGLAVCALIFSACTHSVGGGFEARYRQGLEDYQAGRRTEAIKEYRKALQVNPSSAEAHNDLGVVPKLTTTSASLCTMSASGLPRSRNTAGRCS